MTIAALDDPDLMALRAYWASKCGDATMPRRADIDPTEIPALLPYLCIAEIHQPQRFRFRLIGSAICRRWGENYTGKWLDEFDLAGERTAILEQYAAAAQSAKPRYDTAEFVNEHGRYLHYRRLLLPLSDDGTTPNMLLGAQKPIGIDGYRVPVASGDVRRSTDRRR
jgi:hypothetical protein